MRKARHTLLALLLGLTMSLGMTACGEDDESNGGANVEEPGDEGEDD